MRPDIVPGATFPDYELSDHSAKRRKLSELQGQHPMVLVLSRGGSSVSSQFAIMIWPWNGKRWRRWPCGAAKPDMTGDWDSKHRREDGVLP
jgi:hypothetical protein